MTEQKRGRGRPKKVDVEQKNPDCELATRGYVKCVARAVIKESNHSHYMNSNGCASLIAAVLLSTFWGFIAVSSTIHAPEAAWASGVGAIICWVLFFEVKEIDCDSTTKNIVCNYIPEPIKKYTPPEPACEKKNECE